MHELGITEEILAILAEAAGERKIRRVVLEIGKCSAVLPDAIRFCFELCSEGTRAEGARLEIIEPAGRVRCRLCGAEFLIEQMLGACSCGGMDLDWLSGLELKVKEMETI